jgi:hypothetical protein
MRDLNVSTRSPARARRFAGLLAAGIALLLGLTASPAAAATARSAAACRSPAFRTLLGDDAEPVEISGALDPSVIAQYGVLRRAATAADALPPLNRFGSEVEGEIGSYYPSYIRRLAVLPTGTRYFLVSGLPKLVTLPPARCLPKVERAKLPKIVALEHRLAAEPVYCIGTVGTLGSEHGEVNCARYSAVSTGAGLAESEYAEGPHLELVPDGVASVRLTFHGSPPLVAAVSENAYMFTTPGSSIGLLSARLRKDEKKLIKHERHPDKKELRAALKLIQDLGKERIPKVEWLGAEGKTIKAFTPRAEESLLGLVLPLESSSSPTVTTTSRHIGATIDYGLPGA